MVCYNDFTDEELIALMKGGDRAAFAKVFERYSEVLYSRTYNKIRHKEDARDIIQDVFVKFWNHHADFELKSNLAGYLYIMVRNEVFSYISHKSVITSYASSFQQFKLEKEEITDHRIRERQLAELIAQEIAALPPRMREVFELSRKESLSNKQIAARLGISELTVADQMKKALRKLRIRIGATLTLL